MREHLPVPVPTGVGIGNQIKTVQELRNFLIPESLNYETLMLKYIFYKMHHNACPHKAELSGVVI